jgi:tetratricopeptide (TPR) repeat protein
MKKLLVCLMTTGLFGCSNAATPPASQETAQKEIPITTKSPEAMAAFSKGRDALDNLRFAEAVEPLSEALKLDPDFVTARALHGGATPGADGVKEIEAAANQAARLPEAERVYIQAMLETRRGDIAKSTALWKQLTELAPADWRAHSGLGVRLVTNQDYAGAAAALQRATELNPNAGPALNMLGYANLRQGKYDDAIDAFKRYAAAAPQEPNAQDSLGEALMAGGKFTEAEAAFRKAAELSPRFWNAWEGLAFTKFLAGDWTAGRDAAAKARSAAERPVDRVTAEEITAWAALAQGNTAEALKAFDAAEKVPDVQRTDVVLVPIHRAIALIDARRYRDALSQLASALQLADSGQLPPGATRNVRRQGLAMRAVAESRMGDAAAAQKSVAALEQEAATRPDDKVLQSSLNLARGMAALAQKDLAAARGHFAECSVEDQYCRWQSVLAAEQARDQAAATRARDEILRVYVRDPLYLYVRARLDPRFTRPTT